MRRWVTHVPQTRRVAGRPARGRWIWFPTFVTGLVLALAACSAPTSGSLGAAEPSPVPIATPAGPGSGATPDKRVDLIDYTRITGLPDGVIIRAPETVAALSGAPQDFRDHVAGRIVELARSSSCQVSIGVRVVQTDGFAAGTIRGCQDSDVVWIKDKDGWGEVVAGPEGFDCAALSERGVPAAIAWVACSGPKPRVGAHRNYVLAGPSAAATRTSPSAGSVRSGGSAPSVQAQRSTVSPTPRPTPTPTPSPTATPTPTPTRTPTPTPRATASPTATPSPEESPATGRTPAGHRQYDNSRFGFSCPLPRGWAVTESDNGDGATATDPTGRATASCLGRNTLSDGSPEGEMAGTRAILEGAGVVVRYAHVSDSTYVLSGRRPDGSITYQWYAVGIRSVNGVVWSYPSDMKEALDDAVKSSVWGFTTGDLSAPH